MSSTQELRRDFLRAVRDALALLQTDTELMNKGFSYLYVVDFAAIYGFMYKTPDSPFLSIPGEPDERTFARRQMALKMLFSIFQKPLLLIPPYSGELKNHIRALTMNIGLAELDASLLYKEKLHRLVKASNSFNAFVRIRSEKPPSQIGKKLRNAAVAVGKEYFPELYTSLACITVNGMETLRTLLKEETLQDSDLLIPEMKDAEYPQDTTDTWYKRISEMRNSDRAFQTQTDAIACTYIGLANQRLNARKKIIVFVSPSSSVASVLKNASMLAVPGHENVEVVRDLTYCLLASIHRNGREYDKEMIAKNLSIVTNLLSIYDSHIPVDLREDAKEAALEWERCENLLMMSDGSASAVSTIKPETALDADFLEVLTLLHRAVIEDTGSLAKEIESKLKQLHEETIELNKVIPGVSAVGGFRDIRVYQARRGGRIVLPGLQGELQMTISFSDRDVMHLAHKFKQLKAQGYSYESVLALHNYILDAARKSEGTGDDHLLAGYMLALDRKYELAMSELKTGISKVSGLGQVELLLLSAKICQKLGRPTEGIELLRRSLELDSDDPRTNIEYARALWLKWKVERGGGSAESCLNVSIKHLEVAALRSGKLFGKELQAEMNNVAAYLYTERGIGAADKGSSDLLKAGSHISELEELLEEQDWVGRFFDTRAYWSYATAVNLPDEMRDQRRRLLESAERDIELALELEKNTHSDVGIWREHQILIMNSIRNWERMV